MGRGADTLVVLHGGPGFHHAYLVDVLAPLSRRHTLVFYDQRGRGRSTARNDSAPSVATDLADLETLRRSLRLGRVGLIGHHYGGALAAFYALAHPDRVSRLVLVSPLYPRQAYNYDLTKWGPLDAAMQDDYLRATRAHLDSVDPAGFCRRYWHWYLSPIRVTDRQLVNRLAPAVCDLPAAGIKAIGSTNAAVIRSLSHDWDWRDTLAAVRQPVLVVEGDGEPIQRHAARTWTHHLGAARLWLTAGPSAFPWFGREDEFRRGVGAFLDSGWPAAAQAVPLAPSPDTTGPGAPAS